MLITSLIISSFWQAIKPFILSLAMAVLNTSFALTLYIFIYFKLFKLLNIELALVSFPKFKLDKSKNFNDLQFEKICSIFSTYGITNLERSISFKLVQSWNMLLISLIFPEV